MVAIRSVLLLLMMLAAGAADAAPPRGEPSGTRERAILARMKQQPLIFFVAQGAPNACGPNCNTWIAVEGSIDQEAAQRFREFLNDPARRQLPVFFNSPGGSTGQAVAIGLTLRQYRMTAGVGRTLPDGCAPAPVMGEACRRVVQTKPEHKARLLTAGTRCASGCVYALLGASTRQVAPGTELGIHSVRYLLALSGASPRSPPATDVVHEGLRNYAIEMGVDPDLIDAAAKVSPDTLRWLTRSEIDRFGIATRGFHETRWRTLRETPAIYSISKSFTRADAGGAYRTSGVRVRCSNVAGFLLIYRSELSSADPNRGLQVRLSAGDDEVRFTTVAEPGGSVSYANVARDVIKQAAMRPKLEIAETHSTSETRVFSLSTAGLSEALDQLLKRCDPYREKGPSAAQAN